MYQIPISKVTEKLGRELDPEEFEKLVMGMIDVITPITASRNIDDKTKSVLETFTTNIKDATAEHVETVIGDYMEKWWNMTRVDLDKFANGVDVMRNNSSSLIPAIRAELQLLTKEITCRSSVKGKQGELIIENLLRDNFGYVDIKKIPTQGDFVIAGNVMIEVKYYKTDVNRQNILKFQKNISENPGILVGVMISIGSNISRHRSFEISRREDGKYEIFLPDADQEFIIHVIRTAIELAKTVTPSVRGEDALLRANLINTKVIQPLKCVYNSINASIQSLAEVNRYIMDTIIKNLGDIAQGSL